MSALLTPQCVTEMSQMAGRRQWRKQILPFTTINYNGGSLKIDRGMAENILSAFNDDAYDTVPFVLANARNAHTQEPERAFGTITDLSVEDDGLYATMLLNDTAASLVEEQPKLGVSVRLLENVQRADGKEFAVALQHVLGTFDPKITGMSAWEPVELSNAGMVNIDMSTLTYDLAKEGPMPKKETTDGVKPEDDLDDLTQEEIDAIAADLAKEDPKPGEKPAGEEKTDPPADKAGEKELISAANGDSAAAIELANAQLREQAIELAQMKAHINETNYQAERDSLVRSGIPPAVLNIAAPLLRGSGHTVELSNGEEVDAGQVLRDTLTEYAKQAKLVDLSNPVGFATDTERDQERRNAEEREEFNKQVIEKFRP